MIRDNLFFSPAPDWEGDQWGLKLFEVPLPACPTGSQRILDLSSQFSALNPVREIWNTAVQNTSTPPPARHSA